MTLGVIFKNVIDYVLEFLFYLYHKFANLIRINNNRWSTPHIDT